MSRGGRVAGRSPVGVRVLDLRLCRGRGGRGTGAALGTGVRRLVRCTPFVLNCRLVRMQVDTFITMLPASSHVKEVRREGARGWRAELCVFVVRYRAPPPLLPYPPPPPPPPLLR